MIGFKPHAVPMLWELLPVENLCRDCGRLLHPEEIGHCLECRPPLSVAAEAAGKERRQLRQKLHELKLAVMGVTTLNTQFGRVLDVGNHRRGHKGARHGARRSFERDRGTSREDVQNLEGVRGEKDI